jgi:hypothetical protein
MPHTHVAPVGNRSPGLWVLLLTVFVNLVGFGVIVPLLPFFAESLTPSPGRSR